MPMIMMYSSMPSGCTDRLMAPVNTKVKGYPYTRDHNFGPYGLSYADDRWEMRKAVKVRMIRHVPTN